MIEAISYITNKIMHRTDMRVIYLAFFLLTPACCSAQDTVLNKYGIWVIKDVKILQKTIRKNPGKQMCDISIQVPGIILDLRYAGSNNFMHEPLYPALSTTYLRKAAADSLQAVQKELKQQGLGLKLFDAYRPYAVTERMWEPVKDDRYAADPKKGSGHNRGVAVDISLISLATGAELDMGTGFDNFSDTAHHAFTALPEAVLQNRLLLKSCMERHGFKALDTEWWHYALPDAKNYELLDIPFAELAIKKSYRPKQRKK